MSDKVAARVAAREAVIQAARAAVYDIDQPQAELLRRLRQALERLDAIGTE